MDKKAVTKKRVILVGFDGGQLGFVDALAAELPNFRRFMRDGASMYAVPSVPCDTPTNWTTIATGASSGTHGIAGFHIHQPGKPFEEMTFTFDSDLCRAEYLWQAAERAGKRSILINYPTAFPLRLGSGVVVGGDGTHSNRWYISYLSLYDSTGKRGQAFDIGPAQGWRNLPPSRKPLLQAAIPKVGGVKMAHTPWGVQMEAQTGHAPDQVSTGGDVPPELQPDLTDASSQTYHILIRDPDGRGYSEAYVCRDRDAARPLTVLRQGEWSPFLRDTFATRSGPREGAFRMRLVKLEPDGSSLSLFRTPVQVTEGWCYPAEIGPAITEAVGPYIEALEYCGHAAGADVLVETQALQGEWLVNAAKYLTQREDWDLLMVQIHMPDSINHMLLGKFWPGEPGGLDTADPKALELMRESYRTMDAVLGGMAALADDETYVAFVSDHGAMPIRKRVWLIGALEQAGLLTYVPRDDGCHYVDWPRTRACLFYSSEHIFVNLKGRDPYGIVEPGAEYERVRDEIIATLMSIRDPENGFHPVAVAMRKEQARALGIHGDCFGDVLYFFHPGYSARYYQNNIVPNQIMAEQRGKPLIHDWLGGAHNFWPTDEAGITSTKAMFGIAGPGIRTGYRRPTPINLADVAVTISYLLGFPPPRTADGKVVYDLLS